MTNITLPRFIPKQAFDQLLANGHQTAGGDAIDPSPVVKIFTPDAGATWLLTEIDPDDEDRAFGLCDLGLGFAELGWLRLSELSALRGPLGLPVERDEHFAPTKPLSAYVEDARANGQISV